MGDGADTGRRLFDRPLPLVPQARVAVARCVVATHGEPMMCRAATFAGTGEREGPWLIIAWQVVCWRCARWPAWPAAAATTTMRRRRQPCRTTIRPTTPNQPAPRL